ncbi:MAG: ABC transporter permease [Rhodospirillales bacterium]|nr:ABC transporter permease [Rhodospirillales bacterium]
MSQSVEPAPVALAVERARPPMSPFRRFLSDYAEDRVAVAAFVVFTIILALAMLAPLISPTNPYDLRSLSILDNRQPPGAQSMRGITFWLGSDGLGRDMVSAILYGLRTSLFVGVLSGIAALCLGMAIGLASAYFGGRFDSLVMRLVDLQLSFPSILIALMLLAILGQGVDKVILALVMVQWAYYARAVRGSALVERRREYIEAAQCLALSHWSILFRHLLPNCMPPLIVIGTLQIAHSIALEATLSFLGLGLPPTEPSLGLLISNGFNYLLSGHYWISTYPGIALLVTIFSVNLMGDRLRDVLNPRLQK